MTQQKAGQRPRYSRTGGSWVELRICADRRSGRFAQEHECRRASTNEQHHDHQDHDDDRERAARWLNSRQRGRSSHRRSRRCTPLPSEPEWPSQAAQE